MSKKIAVLTTEIGVTGGAGKASLTLAEHLGERYDVAVFGYSHGDASDDRRDDSVVATDIYCTRHRFSPKEVDRLCRMGELYARLRDRVAAFDPDIVFSQHESVFLGARTSKQLDVPHVLFLHDMLMIPTASEVTNALKRVVHEALISTERRVIANVFGNTDLFIANSDHIASQYREHWGVDPAVVYPFVDPADYEVDRRGESILHVNPSFHKGIDITAQVAERLPEREFLVVGEPSPDSEAVLDRIRALENVTCLGFVHDMKRVYRRTKLALMPSRVEGFGRVPVEAGASGIPTVGSSAGGLPEAIGIDDLVVDTDRPDEYVRAIDRVLSDYEDYSRRARRSAEQRTAASQIETLERVLSERVREF